MRWNAAGGAAESTGTIGPPKPPKSPESGGEARNPLDGPHTLDGSGLLDSVDDEAFDRITRLARRLLRADAAMLSLVDGDRHVPASESGLTDYFAEGGAVRLSRSVGTYAIASGRRFMVEDAREDPLVRDSGLVTEDGLVSYIVEPLESSGGYVIGALCAVTRTPRAWSADDVAVLDELAALAVAEIEHRIRAVEVEELDAIARRLAGPLSRLKDAVRSAAALAAAPDSLTGSPAGQRLRRVADAARARLGPVEAMMQDLTDVTRPTRPEDAARPFRLDLRERVQRSIALVATALRDEDLKIGLGREPVLIDWAGPDLDRALALALMTMVQNLGSEGTVSLMLTVESGRALLTIASPGRRLPTGDLLRVAGAFIGETLESAAVSCRRDVTTVRHDHLVATAMPRGTELRFTASLAAEQPSVPPPERPEPSAELRNPAENG